MAEGQTAHPARYPEDPRSRPEEALSVATFGGGVGAAPVDFSKPSLPPGTAGTVGSAARITPRNVAPKRSGGAVSRDPTVEEQFSEAFQTPRSYRRLKTKEEMDREYRQTVAKGGKIAGAVDVAQSYLDGVMTLQGNDLEDIRHSVHAASIPIDEGLKNRMGTLAGGRFSPQLEALLKKMSPDQRAPFEAFRMSSPFGLPGFVRDVTAKDGAANMVKDLRSLPQMAASGDEDAQTQLLAMIEAGVYGSLLRGVLRPGIGTGLPPKGPKLPRAVVAPSKIVKAGERPRTPGLTSSARGPHYRQRGGIPTDKGREGQGMPHSHPPDPKLPLEETWDDLPGPLKIAKGTHLEPVAAPDGSFTWGIIPEAVAKEAKIPSGRIRVQRGNEKTFGWNHFRRDFRSAEIERRGGRSSPDEYVDFVLKGYNSIYMSQDGRLILARPDRSLQTVVVELVPEDKGGGYTLITAYPLHPGKIIDGQRIWPKPNGPKKNKR
ncbi:hypothetical protein EON79_02365 [bacterium]|nr:MAG: hypothetical protein EON79_02365 [bacterium]